MSQQKPSASEPDGSGCSRGIRRSGDSEPGSHVPTADAEALADELIGPIVDTHVSRAYSNQSFREALSEATARAHVGLSPQAAVEDVAACYELTAEEIEHAVECVEHRMRPRSAVEAFVFGGVVRR